MCTYCYKNFSINKKNHYCRLEEFCPELPVDSEGRCIFHSDDKHWKQAEDFTGYLRGYISYCREHGHEIDLREVHFVSAKGKAQIDYVDLLANANICGSQFHHTIWMIGKKKRKVIPGSLHFTDCIFYHDVIFKHCLFSCDFKIENIAFTNDFGVLHLNVEDCIFEYYFDCNELEDFSAYLSITRCEFREYANFQSVYVQENNFEIEFNEFFKRFSFIDSEIDALVIDFSHNIFKAEAEFTNVAFRGDILFNHPTIEPESKLIFTGTSERKILYGNTRFNIEPDDIQGQIVFQMTNLMLIDSGDLEVLKKLEKTGTGEIKKVVIGAGCIRYRFQSLPKTLKTGMKNGFIIEEFTRSFTIFLSNSIQKVIGIEILDRSSTEITFFYFSDEHGSDEEFMNALSEGRQDFFGIMSGGRPFTKDKNPVKQEALNQFQTKLSQNATVLKIITQMMQQNWKLEDTQALLDALTLPGETLTSAEPFHHQLSQVNVEKLLAASQQSNIPVNLISVMFNVAETIIPIDNMNGNIHSGSDK
ncbi:hypothetical protein [Chryseobacterium sp. SL1]|uniref:hypothetical protein n=1 Tax=Chryseobacterium sp. SL1 TaxID=2995159 RepID=UPI00227486E0|nr:hypothetical protein [Chryseobacterium sp. SL1]MCY1660913.1 hypothetical protein [Chryseobacterium sp. SL1]